MGDAQTIFIGQGGRPQRLLLAKANRHDLIGGALVRSLFRSR